MPKMDSREISIEQINKLDATAFRMLYKTYYKALVCYAIQITGESGAAEDIVQELFSTLWEKQLSFKSLVSFKAYLYNSVRNASIDYLKHKDVEFDYLQKIIESHQEYRVGDEEEDDFFTEEIFRQLFMTIDSLPHMEGKKNEEIAAALYVSLETVKTQKKRAMSLLRKKLSPYHFALLLSILP